MGMTETFLHKGKQWTRHFAPPPDQSFILGCDLGQSQDYTANVILHATRTPLDSWTVNERACTTRQDLEERFDCVFAERLPLGTSYPDVIARVTELLSRPPLREGCHFVLDESGVGRAVADAFDKDGLRPVRVSISAGTDQTKLGGHPRRWSVSKTMLTSGLDIRLHTGELRFAAELTEASNIATELKDFRRHLTAAGRATYQARTGQHDDLVLAVAIALWWAVERHRHQIYVGPLRGLC